MKVGSYVSYNRLTNSCFTASLDCVTFFQETISVTLLSAIMCVIDCMHLLAFFVLVRLVRTE